MSCLEALVRSLLHEPVIHTLEWRFTAPIGIWTFHA